MRGHDSCQKVHVKLDSKRASLLIAEWRYETKDH